MLDAVIFAFLVSISDNNTRLMAFFPEQPGQAGARRTSHSAEMMGWQWHQLDHMQVICTVLQRADHTSTSSFFKGRMLFLLPNQHSPRIEGTFAVLVFWIQNG